EHWKLQPLLVEHEAADPGVNRWRRDPQHHAPDEAPDDDGESDIRNVAAEAATAAERRQINDQEVYEVDLGDKGDQRSNQAGNDSDLARMVLAEVDDDRDRHEGLQDEQQHGAENGEHRIDGDVGLSVGVVGPQEDGEEANPDKRQHRLYRG